MSPPAEDAPWRRIDPPDLARPVGYSHAVESRGGRRLSLAGQVAMDRDGAVLHPGDLVAQAEEAFANVVRVLDAAGARPQHLVRMRIYVTDVGAYHRESEAIGAAYRKHFGRWFPAMTLLQVAGLYDHGALIEVECEAVVPDDGGKPV
jgi:enamine deaminase RidA (YjgF/YER057c/UK114 family)